MGITASCTPSIIAGGGSVKVVDTEGGVEEYIRSIRANELMQRNPGLFVCEASRLKVGYRVPGLAADEELERHRVYFLLPMDMLYSVLLEEEMVALTYRAAKAMKRGGTKRIGRIFPILSEFCLFPGEVKAVVETSVEDLKTERLARQRSWKPALDTIEEVPCMAN